MLVVPHSDVEFIDDRGLSVVGRLPLQSEVHLDTQVLFRRPVVEHLLAQPGIEVDKQDIDGLTALWAAAKNGSMGMVNLLLEAGADPSIKTETQGDPEQMARHKITQYEEIVRRLEQHAEQQSASTNPPANQK